MAGSNASISEFTFTIDDTSPQVVYSPPSFTDTTPGTAQPDHGIDAGWTPFFNGTGYDAYPGQPGVGESLHVTARDGASFSLTFTGTGIQLFGIAFQSSYSISLDSIPPFFPSPPSSSSSSSSSSPSSSASSSAPVPSPSIFTAGFSSTAYSTNVLSGAQPLDPAQTVLASITGLEQGNHTVTLVAFTNNTNGVGHPNSVVLFDRAVVSVHVEAMGSTASASETTIDDTMIQFTGSWTFVNSSSPGAYILPPPPSSSSSSSSSSSPSTGIQINNTYHITQTRGDIAEFTFCGTSIQLDGLLNSTAGLYNVTLSPTNTSITTTNTTTAFSSNKNNITITQQLNASFPFLTPATLFYASGLDPNTSYHLLVTNLEDKTLAIDGLRITGFKEGYISQPSASSSPVSSLSGTLPHSAIIAISVAAFLGLILAALFASLLLWWHRRTARRKRRLRIAANIAGTQRGSTVITSRRKGKEREQVNLDGDVVDISPGMAEVGTFYGFGGEESESGHGHANKDNEGMEISPTSEVEVVTLASLPPMTFAPSPQPPNGKNGNGNKTLTVTGLPRALPMPPTSSPFGLHFQLPPVPNTNEGGFLVPPIVARSGGGASGTRDLKGKQKDPEARFSFLDLASSAASSVRAASRRSRSSRGSRGSRRTSSHSKSQYSSSPHTGDSLALSVDPALHPEGIGLAITTAELSPRHPYSFADTPLPPTGGIQPQQQQQPRDNRSSPTDSLPLTVSDIQFRAEAESTSAEFDNNRWSNGGIHPGRMPHPPLPGQPAPPRPPRLRPTPSSVSATAHGNGHGRSQSADRPSVIAQMIQERRLARAQAEASGSQAPSRQGDSTPDPGTSGSERARSREGGKYKGLGLILGRKIKRKPPPDD
ncbi:hypothetical protein BD410DRAFT_838270 [Rickenella mellea]|uniref:Uncharacterized protein n=1 Tax=Rickenella mellea TaxID=50990 RepID=A0A4Y7Q988_9AGAM|nr:hypothetical protein BD410DRAFT_838270 [Rickenella mellea]